MWIDVEKREPGESGRYLVFCQHNEDNGGYFESVDVSHYSCRHNAWDTGFVTHWQELPDYPDSE